MKAKSIFIFLIVGSCYWAAVFIALSVTHWLYLKFVDEIAPTNIHRQISVIRVSQSISPSIPVCNQSISPSIPVCNQSISPVCNQSISL
ncbi:V(D)J recombination activating protein 1, partial [Dissostichus eleginoides]